MLRKLIGTLALSGLVAACADEEPLAPSTVRGTRSPSSLVGALAAHGTTPTLDGEFLAVSRIYPEFGGLYGEGDSVVVVVNNASAAERARTDAAGHFFATHRWELAPLAAKPRKVRIARYGFAELSMTVPPFSLQR